MIPPLFPTVALSVTTEPLTVIVPLEDRDIVVVAEMSTEPALAPIDTEPVVMLASKPSVESSVIAFCPATDFQVPDFVSYVRSPTVIVVV
jgi:hypothetical protein